VYGIVLAAGRSARMGRPKALLPAAGGSFLAVAASVLRDGGCRRVLAVLPPAAAPKVAPDEAGADPALAGWLAEAAAAAACDVVAGAPAGSEQIASLRRGVEALPADAAAVVVLPVDHPAVRPATVAALIAAWRRSGAGAVRPLHAGSPGHPLLLDRRLFSDLFEGPLPEGVRTILARRPDAVVDVEVADPGILTDVDTPGEYEHFASGAAAFAAAALAARGGGRAVAAVTVVAATGAGGVSVPRPGARLLLLAPDEPLGTLGDPRLDAAAVAHARAALAGAPAATHEVELPGVRMRLFVEAELGPDELLIVGAGHIAVPLAALGVQLGFRVVVLDDRDEFATPERFPDAAEVRQIEFPAAFAGVAIGPRSYVVLVTRAHRYDFDCLAMLLQRPEQPAYIGMVGSRRRIRAALGALLDAGFPRDRLACIHAPIGLDLGAETPAEIALSIAAELVALRRGGTGEPLSRRDRVLERLLPKSPEDAR
jgi:xanthine dehydrogenase accessory factor